jgi:hypothetical protein
MRSEGIDLRPRHVGRDRDPRCLPITNTGFCDSFGLGYPGRADVDRLRGGLPESERLEFGSDLMQFAAGVSRAGQASGP